MSTERIPDDAPASALFPEFETLYDLIAAEVEGLTDEQLDWTSVRWGWAEWSIRRQTSHIGVAAVPLDGRALGGYHLPRRRSRRGGCGRHRSLRE